MEPGRSRESGFLSGSGDGKLTFPSRKHCWEGCSLEMALKQAVCVCVFPTGAQSLGTVQTRCPPLFAPVLDFFFLFAHLKCFVGMHSNSFF